MDKKRIIEDMIVSAARSMALITCQMAEVIDGDVSPDTAKSLHEEARTLYVSLGALRTLVTDDAARR